MLLFLALLCQWLTLGSQAKCKPTLWVLDVWATMRPMCTSFLLLFFYFMTLGFLNLPDLVTTDSDTKVVVPQFFTQDEVEAVRVIFIQVRPVWSHCHITKNAHVYHAAWKNSAFADSEIASSLFCCRDEEIRSKCGIDAVTYLSFQRHIILLMTVVTLLSLAVILPVNISGNLLGIWSWSDGLASSLKSQGISLTSDNNTLHKKSSSVKCT